MSTICMKLDPSIHIGICILVCFYKTRCDRWPDHPISLPSAQIRCCGPVYHEDRAVVGAVDGASLSFLEASRAVRAVARWFFLQHCSTEELLR
jgi:hypothetical protein